MLVPLGKHTSTSATSVVGQPMLQKRSLWEDNNPMSLCTGMCLSPSIIHTAFLLVLGLLRQAIEFYSVQICHTARFSVMLPEHEINEVAICQHHWNLSPLVLRMTVPVRSRQAQWVSRELYWPAALSKVWTSLWLHQLLYLESFFLWSLWRKGFCFPFLGALSLSLCI